MNFNFEVHTKIGRPIEEVFDSVVNPEKMSSYFAVGGVSGPMEQGKAISWKFDDTAFKQDMKIRKLVNNKEIVLDWFSEKGSKTNVTILFDKLADNKTLVTIAHSGYEDNQKGLEDSYSHCEGWTVMLSSLKGYMEHGINLGKDYW